MIPENTQSSGNSSSPPAGTEDSTREKARRELNEREETVKRALHALRTLIDEEVTLQCPTSSEFLLRFLRAKKFHAEKAFKTLKEYYKMRRDNPDIFQDLCPSTLLPIFSQKLQIVLPERDQEGRHIFLFNAGVWEPYQCSLDDIFRANYLCLEEMTSCVETQVHGIVAIVDCAGLSFTHARSFTPKHAKRMIRIIQGAFPARFKAFHLVNQPYIFNLLFSIVKPFLNEKIRNRIHFHGGDLGSLHQWINCEILPESLSGSRSLNDTFINGMLAKNEHYKEMLKYGYANPLA